MGIWATALRSLSFGETSLSDCTSTTAHGFPRMGQLKHPSGRRSFKTVPSVSQCDTQTSLFKLFKKFLLTPDVWKQFLNTQESAISVSVWFSIRGSSCRIWAGFPLSVALGVSAVSFLLSYMLTTFKLLLFCTTWSKSCLKGWYPPDPQRHPCAVQWGVPWSSLGAFM